VTNDAPKPAPLEITIRFDPQRVRAMLRNLRSLALTVAAAGGAVIYALRLPLLFLATLAFAAVLAGVTGSGRSLGLFAAVWLIYGVFWLKARYSPLIRD
jgi:hypothetical protein